MSTQSEPVAVDPLALYPGAVRCVGRRPDGGEGVHYRPLGCKARLLNEDERCSGRPAIIGPAVVLFPGEVVRYSVVSVEAVILSGIAPRWWGEQQDRAVGLLWRRWQDAVRVEAEYASREERYKAADKADLDRFRPQAEELGVHPGMLLFLSLPTRTEGEREAARVAGAARAENRRLLRDARAEIEGLVREMSDFEADHRPRDPDARDLRREYAEDVALREQWLADVRERVGAMSDAEVAAIVEAERRSAL